jgi:ferredoxin
MKVEEPDLNSEIIIEVDRARCQGHARCNAERPDIFELDDDGYSSLTRLSVPAARRADAEAGANACPERAIAVWSACAGASRPDGSPR